jgi:hypothetical protein
MKMTTNEASLLVDYADLGVSCGYIGDISRQRDDRSFRVFTKLATEPYRCSPNVSVHVFDVPRGTRLWSEKVVFDTPKVRARLDLIRAKLDAGKLHRVSG